MSLIHRPVGSADCLGSVASPQWTSPTPNGHLHNVVRVLLVRIDCPGAGFSAETELLAAVCYGAPSCGASAFIKVPMSYPGSSDMGQ